MLTTPTNAEYSTYLDIEEDDLSTYSEEALAQGVDLMWLATELEVDPTNEQKLRIVRRGIMAAAEGMEESQGHRTAILSPFTAETLGSYSYEKMSRSVQSGVPTGLLWFDAAVRMFTAALSTTSDAVSLFERPTDLRAGFLVENGKVTGPALLGPADLF